MLISKTAYVTWNSRNKKHYEEAGYQFTRMKEKLLVSVEDLTPGSQAMVDVECDYCGKRYQIAWNTYVAMKRRTLPSDCCKECCEKKAMDAVKHIYGGYKEMFEDSNERRQQTNMERYGSKNVFESDEIKRRITQKNTEKYGVPYSQQNSDVRQKTVATCREKYGVDNYVELFKGKFIGANSPVWKGGVEYSRAERATHEYISWRKSVFERDRYTCVRCGKKNGQGFGRVELHAHHIKNWHDFPEERYDLNNGITLCDECHYMFHSIYGKKHNSAQQIQEFIYPDKKIC